MPGKGDPTTATVPSQAWHPRVILTEPQPERVRTRLGSRLARAQELHLPLSQPRKVTAAGGFPPPPSCTQRQTVLEMGKGKKGEGE